MVKIVFPKIDLSGVRGVFLDIDDTLYDYEYAHKIAIKECESKSNIPNFSQLYKKHRDIVTERLAPQGSCRSRLLAFISMFEELEEANPYELALYYDKLYWDSLIENMKASSDAMTFIDTCKRENIKIIIVTDMLTSVQIQKLQKLNILDKIDYLVTSEEAGAEKSEQKIFELALKKSGYKVKEVICIGDNEEKDYNVPKKLGIKSYLVKRVNEI